MKKLIMTAAMLSMAAPAATPVYAAGAVDYRIVVRTKTNDSWTDGFGTDNFIDMTMHGQTGKKKLELKGHHESGQTDAFTYSTKDIGVIKKITIDVSGDLADKWSPLDIKILRGTDSDASETADGWSSFFINKELGYDPISFKASKFTDKAVTIKPNGEIVSTSVTQTFVNTADNLSSPDSTKLMRFMEDWKHTKTVGMANSRSNSFTTGTKFSYNYEKETLIAKHRVGLEVSQSWTHTIGKVQTKSDQWAEESKFDWTMEVPRNTFLFRRMAFRVPFADQMYKDSRGNSFAIRKLGGKIAPLTSAGLIQAVPELDRSNKIVPISMSKLESRFLRYMEIADLRLLYRDYIEDWQKRGWIVSDKVDQRGVGANNAQHFVFGWSKNRLGRLVNSTDKNWALKLFKGGNGVVFEEKRRTSNKIYMTSKGGWELEVDLKAKVINQRSNKAKPFTRYRHIFSAST